MALSQPATALLHTVAYSTVFSSVPTWQTLHRWLLGDSLYTHDQIDQARKELLKQKRWGKYVTQLGKHHFPVEKWRGVFLFVSWVRLIPWIQSIWVTGSMGAGVAQEDDDIDFFLITDPKRLWLSRFFVILMGMILGRYRSHALSSHRVRDRWCCNMWLESDRQTIFWANQNVYTARELVQAIPVYARWDTQPEILLQANPWVAHWTANGWNFSQHRAKKTTKIVPSLVGSALQKLPLSWINTIFFVLQFSFLRHRITSERVEAGVAFFHPRSLPHPVVKRYEKITKQWNLPPLFPSSR